MNYEKKPIPKQGGLFYGADYNPDQWQHAPEVLERDIELMKEAGVTSASIGIFAWTALEPKEGNYEFAWLDAVMDRFTKEGMYVFLATPSGSKPMWLSEKYAEVRRVNNDGIRDASGWRHNHCLSSPIYREKTRAINSQLAQRYKDHSALALWHVGNEYSGDCHCELCRSAFQDWLKKRYKTLDALNTAWWSSFWNHTFTDWGQIQTVDPSIDALRLDWMRFVNDQHVSFMLNEMIPLREFTPDVPCMTNFMGTHEGTNYWQWAEHVDIIANDLYPLPADNADSWRYSIQSDFIHSLMRGMSGGKPWMLLECSPSSVNWGKINKLKRPNAHRQEVIQAVANGANTIHYFQWRKGRGGFEKFHGAVVDHEGSNQSRVFQDCATIGRELNQLSVVHDTDCPQAEVAMLYDWESRWALNASQGPKVLTGDGPFKSDLYTELCFDHYEALTCCGITVDQVSTKSDFSTYKVLILPALYLLTQELADRICQFTQSGGQVVATCLTGYVDLTNCCWLGGFPGAGLAELFGVWNEELDNIHDEERVRVMGQFSGFARNVVERVHLRGAKSIAQAGSEFYAGHPLITEHRCEAGHAFYLAACFDCAVLVDFYQSLAIRFDLSRTIDADLPAGVVFRRREFADEKYGFLFNYTQETHRIDLKEHSFLDFATESNCTGKLELKPYETRVLKIQ
ncbi:MAG: beta-galactosidase [Verrucomicrobiota bacterium]|nr:beta-galactosidase [Verrucomicrobiota bacterium]